MTSIFIRSSLPLRKADFLDKDIAEEAARILARGIVAAFYDFKISHERMTRLGLSGKGRE